MPIVIATLFAALSGPIAKKILIALGFGLISFVGFGTIKAGLGTAITGYLGAMSGALYGLLGLIGFVDAVGIWLGAFTAVVAVLSAKRLALL